MHPVFVAPDNSGSDSAILTLQEEAVNDNPAIADWSQNTEVQKFVEAINPAVAAVASNV